MAVVTPSSTAIALNKAERPFSALEVSLGTAKYLIVRRGHERVFISHCTFDCGSIVLLILMYTSLNFGTLDARSNTKSTSTKEIGRMEDTHLTLSLAFATTRSVATLRGGLRYLRVGIECVRDVLKSFVKDGLGGFASFPSFASGAFGLELLERGLEGVILRSVGAGSDAVEVAHSFGTLADVE